MKPNEHPRTVISDPAMIARSNDVHREEAPAWRPGTMGPARSAAHAITTRDPAASQLGPLFGPTHAELARSLDEAATQYWLLPDETPLEEYRSLYGTIVDLEARLDPATVDRTLAETATAFHRDTGHCPFCREPGPLHLTLATDRTPSAGEHASHRAHDATSHHTLPLL